MSVYRQRREIISPVISFAVNGDPFINFGRSDGKQRKHRLRYRSYRVDAGLNVELSSKIVSVSFS